MGDPIVVVVVDVLVVDVLVVDVLDVVVDAVVVVDEPAVVVDAVVVAGSAVPEDEQADAARISATRPIVLRRIGQS